MASRTTPSTRALLVLAVAAGCAAQLAASERSSADAPPKARAAKPASPPPPCAENMSLVADGAERFCVDRYEAAIERRVGDKSTPWPGNQPVDEIESEMLAVSQPERKPQGYISGKQAALACEHAGKRLCTPAEWVSACEGPRKTLYPYGEKRRADVCNDRFEKLDHHPVVRLWKTSAPPDSDPKLMWYPRFMNDPRLHELPHTVSATGAFPECSNEYGAYDMVGNLHEWVADPAGTFQGGFFMDTFQNGEGCAYRTTGHEFEYHDYSTGFRCCADAKQP